MLRTAEPGGRRRRYDKCLRMCLCICACMHMCMCNILKSADSDVGVGRSYFQVGPTFRA